MVDVSRVREARSGGRARDARRRLVRRALRAPRRGRPAGLAGGRRGGARRARERLGAMPDLAGRVALVTGTAGGIGAAIERALAENGAIAARRATGTRCDVTDAEQVAALVERIGSIDILVNNAGGVCGQVGRPLEEVSDDDWRAIVDANLTSTFVCTRAVVPGMKASGLRAHRQHLVRRGTQRQPHGHPGLRQRQGRRRSASRGRRPTSSAASGSPSTHRPRLRARRTRPAISAVGELRRGEAGALLEQIATRRLGHARGHRERRALLRRRGVDWVTGQVLSIDGGYSMF